MAKKSAAQPTSKKSSTSKSGPKGHAPTMAAAAGAAAGAAAAQQAAAGGLNPGGGPPAAPGGPPGPPPDPAIAGAAAAPSMVPPGGPPGAQPPAPPMAPPGPPMGGPPGAPPAALSMQPPAPGPGGAPGAPPAMAAPTQGPTGPVGAYAAQPTGSAGARSDTRTQANFKDLPPLGQAQAMAQGGIDPMAGNKMAAQQLQSSLAQPAGPDAQGIPNAFSGPGVPPGLENLPNDMAALHGMITPLTATMARGFSPGASTGEHQQALNASALARAHAAVSLGRAQGQIDHHRNKTMLAQHLMALHQAGQLPSAEDIAQHALAAQPPQMQPQLAGSAVSATPGY